MTSDSYPYPVAISALIEDEKSHEPQNLRAISWLLQQPGRSVVVVTPRKNVSSPSIQRLIQLPGVSHQSRRGFSPGLLSGHRVLLAWPSRQDLNNLWGIEIDALAVIEWNDKATAEWVAIANPVHLSGAQVTQNPEANAQDPDPLPERVASILEHVAGMAAGYSSGLKWNEEDQLKADMMNRPDRWESISVEQVRSKCRELGMRPNDVDTIAGFLQRRKDGRRFNVRSTYKTFQFN
jgi:hypothetical protein